MKLKLCCGILAAAGLLTFSLFAQENKTAESEKHITLRLLDESVAMTDREKLFNSQSDKATELIAALSADLTDERSEQYRRIPWLWRAAIAAGKRNRLDELKDILAISLPKADEPLRDWQAVVIGGGIINGISQRNDWPADRIREIIASDADLKSRWTRALQLARAMADDESIPPGTRYDALRIMGADTWENSGSRLIKYLLPGAHAELQQGAISAVSDIRSENVAGALLADMAHFSPGNKQLALDALVRDEARISPLLDAILIGRIDRAVFSQAQLEKIKTVSDKKVRARAEKLLAVEKTDFHMVGAASVDITPDYPVRLSGYAGRKTESEGVAQHIFAKAIAIGSEKDVAVLITVENVGVPGAMRDEVARRLAQKMKIPNERIAVCSTHSHTAPFLKGTLPTLFGEDIPAEHHKNIDKYYSELTDKMELAATLALDDRKPAKLSSGKTKATFAANRRTKGGPVDHDVPVLLATDKDQNIRAMFLNYACHCTTLGGEFNQICGDWAGYAQEILEAKYPGAIALVAIGCGADSNPHPRTGLDLAKKHGQEIASAVEALLTKSLKPVQTKLQCRAKQIKLPLDKLPSTQEWEERAKKQDFAGYQARKVLESLDKGEVLRTEIPYLVQTWNFGDELAMVFLPGEVVVDYALRLKKEFDPDRIWVNAYANDVPCYIPSKRIWKEGGYEGGGAMIFYNVPARLAESTEEQIIGTVHELLPKTFIFDEKSIESPEPKAIAKVYETFQKKPWFVLSAVANEPLIVDPVAIDFTTDGKLLVCEMHDYPTGMDGNLKSGGRIKLLEDKNKDGEFDTASLFLDDLPFPTGLMQWRDGVLICAAPDIIYARDTNGDGRADVVKKLFTGFATHNYQARVNSLRWGLDNWVYAAGGLFGGKIKSEITGKEVDCNARDFRFRPDTGEIEPLAGTSQQGRARDDWDNWFGCNNSVLLMHYPLPDRYVRRNPFVTTPEPHVSPIKDSDPNLLYPVSRTLERFNNPNSANRTTSASGVEIYRDDLLGEEFYGNSFSGETVHNLVRRYVLQRNGATFTGTRANDEKTSEFFASTDNWFRPAEIRTGPDGALWIVDMYRFVIEHPRWIPADRLAKLDVRAGEDKGRIYKIYPATSKLRPVRDLTRISTKQLVEILDTPNGTMRDLVHRELFQRQDKSAVKLLKKLAQEAQSPAVRVQTLYVLDGLNSLWPEDVYMALKDSDPRIRTSAVRLSEDFISSGRTTDRDHFSDLGWNPALPLIKKTLMAMVNDPDAGVRYQLALSLGEWRNEPQVAQALSELAKKGIPDQWMRAAILSSSSKWPAEVLTAVLSLEEETPGRQEAINQLVATAAGADDPRILQSALLAIAPSEDEAAATWQFTALANLQETLERKKLSLDSVSRFAAPDVREGIERLEKIAATAGKLAVNEKEPIEKREAALRLLNSVENESDLKTLVHFALRESNARLQKAAQKTLRRQHAFDLSRMLVSGWKNSLVSARPAIVDMLLEREEGIQKLIEGIEDGFIAPSEISPTVRQSLLKHENETFRKRAASLFPQNENRKAVLAKYSAEVAKLTGNPERGGQIFSQTCASCHGFRGQGFAVGPDLAPLTDKSPDDFLLAILDPNSVIEPRFVSYNIETKDGRSFSGIVSAETGTSVTVSQAGGVVEKILRADISEMRASTLSLMPEGLEEGRTAQDYADLISYLKSRPSALGENSAQHALTARKKFIAAGVNGFAKLISASEQTDYPSWIGSLPLAHCRQTDGKSKVVWQTDPLPREINGNQLYFFRLAAAMGFRSEAAGKFYLSVNGKIVLYFDVTLADQTWTSADGRITMRYQAMENNSEDSNGVLTFSIKGDILDTGSPVNLEVGGGAANSQRWFGIYLISPEMRATR